MAIFSIAAVVIYYNLLLKPQFLGFITYNREYISVKRAFKAAQTLIANEDRIKGDYDNLKKQVGVLDVNFSGQDDISSLLQDFSRIAEDSGVKILRIKPLDVLDNISQVPLLLKAQSSCVDSFSGAGHSVILQNEMINRPYIPAIFPLP